MKRADACKTEKIGFQTQINRLMGTYMTAEVDECGEVVRFITPKGRSYYPGTDAYKACLHSYRQQF